MYFDRFDICKAHYLFLSEFHEGQFSKKYARLSRLFQYYTPNLNIAGAHNLSENARAIYDCLVDKEKIPQTSEPSNVAMINALFGGTNQWDY